MLDVLRAMGYGGAGENSTTHLGQSGDEGVDGVIREDELGLDLIYVQAKRWPNPVGRPEIQKFFGALHGKRASKGVFITTSSFTSEAAAYADGVTPRIILIDGHQLARLMVDYGVGVSTVETYELKRVNLDYFADEDDAAAGPRAADALINRAGTAGRTRPRSGIGIERRHTACELSAVPPVWELNDERHDAVGLSWSASARTLIRTPASSSSGRWPTPTGISRRMARDGLADRRDGQLAGALGASAARAPRRPRAADR